MDDALKDALDQLVSDATLSGLMSGNDLMTDAPPSEGSRFHPSSGSRRRPLAARPS